jgi:putative peptidoglycan lipid II flippase
MAVLNAHKRFWVASLAPAFFNLGFLIVAQLPDSVVSFSGQQLALGVLLGGLLQLFIVGFDHVKHIGLPKFNFSFSNKVFLKVLVATLPSIAGIGVLQFISLINISLCAKVGVGAITYLYLADRILELPLSLIAVSLGTVMLPNLSELWVKDRGSFDKTLSQSLRFFLFLALPGAVGLIFMALPIAQLLFQRGETTFEEVLKVASIVQVYGGVLIISGMNKMFLPIYYSFKNTWYPACVSLVVVSSHYFLGSYLVEIYALKGVVISTLIATSINFTCLSLGLKFFIGRSYLNVVLKSLLHFIPSTAILALGLYIFVGYIPTDKNPMFFVLSLIAIVLSALSYFGLSFALKIKETEYLKPILKKLGVHF